MSDSNLLSSNTIFLDMTAKNYNEVFSVVYKELLRNNYVEEGFLEALIKREEEYPTGLQGVDTVIAIPHADPVYIKRSFIAAVRTIEPVTFMEMTKSGLSLKTRIIFILGLKRDGEQLMTLKAIVDNFAKDSILSEAFLKAKNIRECLDILKPLEVDKEIT